MSIASNVGRLKGQVFAMNAIRGAILASIGITSAVTALLGASPVASAAPDPRPAAPCYNGIAPFNPYVDNCALPQRPPRVLGSAPDQTALLNCSVGSKTLRAVCLSQYVNGGTYPGFVVGFG
jgi:hypothetical protein